MGSFKKIVFLAAVALGFVFGPGKDGFSIAASTAFNDCLLYKDGQRVVKLPLALKDLFGKRTADQEVTETSCKGQYQIPISQAVVEKIHAWATSDESCEKTETFELLSHGLTFSVDVSRLTKGGSDSQIFSIVRLRDREAIEKQVHEKGASLNFSVGYLTPSNGSAPKYSDDICPLLSPSEIQGLVWMVFPTSRGGDRCDEKYNTFNISRSLPLKSIH